MWEVLRPKIDPVPAHQVRVLQEEPVQVSLLREDGTTKVRHKIARLQGAFGTKGRIRADIQELGLLQWEITFFR